MAAVLLVLAEGFEEIEAVTVLDILSRGNVSVTTASLTGSLSVKGAHGLTVVADDGLDELGLKGFDMIVIPGGPGTNNYFKCDRLLSLLKEYNENGKKLAAICAAPSVLGELGILRGKKAVCYPGFENRLTGAEILGEPVVTDGNITTSRGPGTAVNFALRLVALLEGVEVSEEVRKGLLFP